jgi:hypothetical protein
MRRDRPRATRVAADPKGPLVDGEGYHYADAFEISLPAPDMRTAEQVARAALDNAPRLIRMGMVAAQRYLLGFRLGPLSAPDHIQGWRIVRAEPEAVQLEAVGLLGRAVVVGSRPDPHTAVLSTYNFYARPALGRLLWAVGGPMHRRIAAYLMERAVADPETVPAP